MANVMHAAKAACLAQVCMAGRVKDVMLAGNVYAALKDITAMSKERAWWTHG